jgi:hypothetical protein
VQTFWTPAGVGRAEVLVGFTAPLSPLKRPVVEHPNSGDFRSICRRIIWGRAGATTVSLNLPETLELRAHNSAPLLASRPIDTPEAIPADQCEAAKLAADLCGVKTRAVANVVLGEVVSLLSWGQSLETADNLYTAIAFLGELGPTNATEALLSAQMIGTHQAATQFLRRALASEQTEEGTETNANRAIRLMRLFIEQLEAMTKLKGKGGHRPEKSRESPAVLHGVLT